MKSKFALVAFASILSSQLCVAQDKAPADDWKPAPSNQAGKEYPQFNSEGRVKFRIVAPKAQRVGVSFRDSSDFTKGEDGAWIGYTRPLDEGFHYTPSILTGPMFPIQTATISTAPDAGAALSRFRPKIRTSTR